MASQGKRRSPGRRSKTSTILGGQFVVDTSHRDPSVGSPRRRHIRARGVLVIGRLDRPVRCRPVGRGHLGGFGRRPVRGRVGRRGRRSQDRDICRRRRRRRRRLRRRQGRGPGQPHRHPARLGELRPDDHRLHGEVRDQGPVGPARRRQRGRDQRRQEPRRHRPPARHLRPRRRPSPWPTPTCSRPYKVATWADIPDANKEATGALDQQLHRLPVDRLRREARRHHQGRRPRRSQVQGQGRPQRRPAQGGGRLQRRRPGGTGQRRLGRQHRPRRRLLQEAGRLGQPHPGRPEPGDDRIRPDPDRDRLDVQRRVPRPRRSRPRASTGRSSSRRTPRRSPRSTTTRSTRTPRIPRPPAAGWSTSSRRRARTPG